ncbi:MAG: hypothetical protein M3Y86_09895 [Verrucomicrobiota bacterium]|nr:hypothetical protein [Verrucomicrobiota bacterium]
MAALKVVVVCGGYFLAVQVAFSQVALPAVRTDGTPLAQNDAAIEQARLFHQPIAVSSPAITPDGMALGDSSSTDESFGDQVILKSSPRPRLFTLSGDATVFYTNNAALTRRATAADEFLVVHAGGSWTPHLAANLDAQIGAAVSIFRYHATSSLDFTNLGAGAGLSWSPATLRGLAVFARYDFVELLNRHSRQILQDHEFTIGAQKVFALGRAHAITLGGLAMAGLSNPHVAQRDQLGVFVGYQLQLTRNFDSEISYRPALHFYNSSGRVDLNQIVSWNLRYRITPWSEADAFVSFGTNRSDRGVFDYDVFSAGLGLGVSGKF